MKTLIACLCLVILASQLDASAQLFEGLKTIVKTATDDDDTKVISEDDAIAGLKEALIQGVNNGTDLVSQVDGYFRNPAIKIPFPEDAQKVESALRRTGLGKHVDRAVLSMNRAAEDAAGEAAEVFVASIKQMSFTDAVDIVKGDSAAATQYLQETTSDTLRERFRPIIDRSLRKVDATKYWNAAFSSYNKIPFVTKVNPDLSDYVTAKAMDGLFTMIAKEESLIRKDPLARTSEILKKVFGD